MAEKISFGDIARRTLGIALFTFIPGTGVGAGVEFMTNGSDPNYALAAIQGGINAAFSAYTTVLIFLGVQLAWNGKMTSKDVETGFRQAAAKAAEDNEELQDALALSEKGEFNYSDLNFDSDDELFGDDPDDDKDGDDDDNVAPATPTPPYSLN
jgi:hypothetical protein